jgi:protein-S-isoprenylcysteine O-methyltransferase
MLGNPLCTFAYAFKSWEFFAERIPIEEHHLASFYPSDYPAYVKRSYIGIPFIPEKTPIRGTHRD